LAEPFAEAAVLMLAVPRQIAITPSRYGSARGRAIRSASSRIFPPFFTPRGAPS